MRKLKIAYGRSCNAAKWSNAEISWEDLCGKLHSTIRTAETEDDYRNMSREDRVRAKDRGGFVGGYLKDGRRLKQNVTCRSLLTLDCDRAEIGFIERFTKECTFAAFLYTTHGHRPEAPRVRIVIPLKEDISPDRYAALSRLYAAEWGINQFDPCSYKVNQLMYWPTTPSDGEYIHQEIKGPFMNADKYLASYPGWTDCSSLPVSDLEKKVRESDGRKQEDPLKKEGIVGTFCRTYTIRDAIAKFLSGTYAVSEVPGRYDYIPGEGTAGVVIYDDKFAYSHHATDPAGGKLLNAFDLVRLHRFKDDDEKSSFLKMSALAEADELVAETLQKEKIEQAKNDFEKVTSSWELPLPFSEHSVMPFPLNTLPGKIRKYVTEVAESTQTPVDMAGCAALSVMATCMQGKFVIRGKTDWIEPVNIYITEIALPSERKSTIQHAMVRPVSDYENRYNKEHAAEVETSVMTGRALQRRQKALEDLIAKGKADKLSVDQMAKEITEFREIRPLRLFVDDITPEKLVSVLAENQGRIALLSSEAGIFDTLAGSYSKSVNIDVMLKSYTGDQIRVDRIGRASECVLRPSLTILLMAQPNVISKVLGNATFRGRGLTARFLYSMPDSAVGIRQYRSEPVSKSAYEDYQQMVFNMLEDEYRPDEEVITLSPEADVLLAEFAQDLEPKLIKEYADMADWCGKLAGNVLRIAGLLCRAGCYRAHEFLDIPAPLVVDEQTMRSAIQLGRYFLNHALAVFNVLPENAMFQKAHTILKMLHEKGLKEFSRRDAMRNCRTFKTVDEIQPVLNFLEDYGYIAAFSLPPSSGKGRPPMPKYAVNPWVKQHYRPFLPNSVTLHRKQI